MKSKLLLAWVALALTSGAPSFADVLVELEPAHAGHVDFTVTNPSDNPMGIPAIWAGGRRLAGEIFEVTDSSGRALPYIGALAEAASDQEVVLAPGESRTFDIDLSSGYEAQISGTHRIVGPAGAETEVWLDVPDDCDEGGCGDTEEPFEPFEPMKGCSPTQIGRWTDEIVPWATLLATISRTHLEGDDSDPLKPRNSLWFGSAISANQAYGVIAEVEARLRNPSTIDFSCQCPHEWATWATAFVMNGDSDRIFVCPLFWTFPTRASKPEFAKTTGAAAILIHEVTHFANVGATTDAEHGYGYDGAKSHAAAHPGAAYRNAENYEMHAQNNPCVGCTP